MNGPKSEDIQVLNPGIFVNLEQDKLIGAKNLLSKLADSYISGAWSCKKLDVFFEKLFRSGILANNNEIILVKWWNRLARNSLLDRLMPHMEDRAAFHHDLYITMLDNYMDYSCAIWDEDTDCLEQAQARKMDLLCRKLNIKSDNKVLVLQCNYGGLVKYIQSRYCIEVIGCTDSRVQLAYAKKIYDLDLIYSNLLNYKSHNKFDSLLVVEGLEYLKVSQYGNFFKMAYDLLLGGGKILIQCKVTNTEHDHILDLATEYCLPYGTVNIEVLLKSIKGRFKIENIDSINHHYPKSTAKWIHNLDKVGLDYDKSLLRLWKFYLSSIAGASKSNKLDVLQILLSKI